jgi:hypothetical protein
MWLAELLAHGLIGQKAGKRTTSPSQRFPNSEHEPEEGK